MSEIVVLILHVTGMDCGHCASRIDRLLGRVPGVHQASSDYDSGQVRVTFDAAVATAIDLVNRVDQAGFTVTRVEPTDAS